MGACVTRAFMYSSCVTQSDSLPFHEFVIQNTAVLGAMGYLQHSVLQQLCIGRQSLESNE